MPTHYLARFLTRKPSLALCFVIALSLTFLVGIIKICLLTSEGAVVTTLAALLTVFLCGLAGGWRCCLFGSLMSIGGNWLYQRSAAGTIYAFGYSLISIIFYTITLAGICILFYYAERFLKELVNSEQRFRRIIDRSAEALVICDADGHITYCCASAEHLLSSSSNHILSTTLFDHVFEDDEKEVKFQYILLQLKKNKGSKILKFRLKKTDGSLQWVECCLNNLLQDELVRSMIIYLRDITVSVNDQKHQDDFIHMAAHELKNPITAIKGYSQLLQIQFQKAGHLNQLNIQTRLAHQTDKLLSLIDDMLNVTRIKTGALLYHFEQTELGYCVNEAVDAMRSSTTSHQLAISLPDRPVCLSMDKTRISQVVTNFLNNAIKYSPEGDLVEIILAVEGSAAVCHVKDQGIGIALIDQKRIFDRFYRADTLSKGKFEGLGLGLYICADIVEKHHGKIGVTSDGMNGSDFWFSLPLM